MTNSLQEALEIIDNLDLSILSIDEKLAILKARNCCQRVLDAGICDECKKKILDKPNR